MVKDIKTILTELNAYGDSISKLPQILVLNKTDAVEDDHLNESKSAVETVFKNVFVDIYTISAATTNGTKLLCQKAWAELLKTRKKIDLQAEPDLIEDEKARARPADNFVITREKKMFFIESDRIERLIAVTDLKDPDSLFHLHQILRSMGVVDELIRQGAKPGSDIVAGGLAFTFGEGMM